MKALLRIVAAALCLGAAPLAAQQVIECGTSSTERVLCSAGGRIESAKLVRDLSYNRCSAAGSWGWTGNAIWADNGCRGRFEVTYTGTAGGADSVPRGDRITCGTLTSRRQECPTKGVLDTVTVAEENMFARCRQGSNWGYRDSVVWAGNGCRAEFQVTYRDTLSASPGDAPAAATRRITCGNYSSAQVTCPTEGYAADVRLVRDYTGTRCEEGATWGHTVASIWTSRGCRGDFEVTYRDTATAGTRRLTCGTTSDTQVQCNAGGRVAKARVVRNIGTSICREHVNWKHADETIWAGRGCRAEFEVTFARDTATRLRPVTPAAPTRVITCGNASGAAMSCNAFGRVATVSLRRDRSGGRCGQSSSWGLNDATVWVARGCYGEFEVTYAGETLR